MTQRPYQLAIQARQYGNDKQAELLLQSITASDPDFADALLTLAVIAYERGNFQGAANQFSRLIAVQPGKAEHHCNLGECLRECGRFEEAARQLQFGISINPSQPDALNSLGLIYHSQHKLDEAESALRQALSLRPDFALAMINLGMVLQEKRKLKEAAEWFRRALDIEPDQPMANSNLGQILVEIGRIDNLDEAEMRCRKAIALTPDRPHPINNLGNVFRSMGRFEDAVECYQRAIAIAPGLAMPVNNMAQAMQGRGRFEEATDYYLKAIAMEPLNPRFHANYASMMSDQYEYQKALERYQYVLSIDPLHAESQTGLGQVYSHLQQSELAEIAFRKAIAIDQELSSARIGLANLYTELGQFEKAEEQYEVVLNDHPNCVEVYYQRATHHKGKISDSDFQKMLELTDEKYLGDAARAQLHYGIATVFDQRKGYETAREHFQKANALQKLAKSKRNETYDPEQYHQWIDLLIQYFTPDLIERLKDAGSESYRPVFVVGLPRSGTTLTEQILASHSTVFGAGELMTISDSFDRFRKSISDQTKTGFSISHYLNSATLKNVAGEILSELNRKNESSQRIVDKMPDNINFLGWIRLVFPHSKIIHCRRDLRDIALSCYQTCFGSIRWANDWEHIASRFKEYERIVKHWQSIPEIEWLDFQYEKLITEPEEYARKLIDYVGLDWEPQCLNFHETKRQVRTASVSQVREPIYQTSKAKWRHYEELMQPFLDQMEEHD